MGFVKTKDGIEIYYKDWGKGQPIVFSHGWPLSGDDWDNQMLFFLKQGYRVIAHDRRGKTRFGDAHLAADLLDRRPILRLSQSEADLSFVNRLRGMASILLQHQDARKNCTPPGPVLGVRTSCQQRQLPLGQRSKSVRSVRAGSCRQ
jgi:hypothetical protein